MRLRGLVALGTIVGLAQAGAFALAASRDEVVRPATRFDAAERFEAYPGGAATSLKSADGNAFSHPSGNLGFDQRGDFFVGNGVFKKLWVTAPSSTTASDGLGPLYNARSCQGCHLKDGRGHPPERAGEAASFVLGLSVPADTGDPPQSASELVVPEPTYGAQLHDHAAPGLQPEGRVSVSYEEDAVELAGGEVARLRRPTYVIEDSAYGPLHPDLQTSPRVAQPMIGLGLLEAIAAEDILARADPEDADGDGISGRAGRAVDVATGDTALGRFGWKAIQPNVRQQSAFAFATDMGLSSSLVPHPEGDCTDLQKACVDGPHGISGDDAHEVPDDLLDLVAFYARNLAVPARRTPDDATVLRGKELVYAMGCTSCHTPKFVTAETDDVPAHLRRQLIWPYTDLLLHDMGDRLADGRPQGDASGREWRTPPLWGIGLTETVNGHTQFLHDGRARDLTEAILWHGGEAEAARDAFAALSPAEREAVLAFLNSL